MVQVPFLENLTEWSAP